MSTVISVENISKRYRLGEINRGTLVQDLESWWARFCGREDPNSKIFGKKAGGDFWALKDVSFQVEEGETLGIIGRNGAGKSTLLKLLSRITGPTSGMFRLRGKVASLLEVGTGFHPELSGRDNIFLNGSILGMTHKETARKFDDIVGFAELEKFIDTPVKRYSSGMYVRLAFAVAAHLEPEILIVDEVLAVGDVKFQKKCLGKMQEITKKGERTILFVSHNMAAVNNLCTRALLIEKGELAFDGSTSDSILAYYQRCGAISSTLCQRNFPPEDSKNPSIVWVGSVSIQDQLGNEICDFRVHDPIHLSLEYRIKQDTDLIHVPNIHVYTADGQCVFVSNQPFVEKMKTGHYRANMEIPANFLNEGAYSIDFALTSYDLEKSEMNVQFYEKGVFGITVSDDQFDTKMRYGYSGSMPGIIRPTFPWNTLQLS